MRNLLDNLNEQLPGFESKLEKLNQECDFSQMTQFMCEFEAIYKQYMAFGLTSIGADPKKNSQYKMATSSGTQPYVPTQSDSNTYRTEILAIGTRVDAIASQVDVICEKFRPTPDASLMGRFFTEISKKQPVGCEPPPGSKVVDGVTVVPKQNARF